MAFSNFPYTDFHNLNLDWVVLTTKDLNTKWDNYYKEWYEWQTTTQKKFDDLYDFVNNYFDNLDVQDEIDKKLDEMAADGSLATILGLYSVRVFDTFDVATKNVANITYRVLGRHAVNDGGAAFWKTQLTEPTDMYYEKYGNVYHVLVQSPINVVACGCVDTNGKIDVDKLNSIRPRNGIFFPAGYYYADKTINVFGSIYGSPISSPQINHTTGEVGGWRTASNAVIDSTANPIIQVNDSCVVENIVFRGHSYYQTENRELARQGNEQPIYSRFETGDQTGIYLHDYGSRANGCYVYYCRSGIKCDYYAKVNDCFVFECYFGIYILANDNNVINSRAYDCYIGYFLTGSLNTIIDCRCDGMSSTGLVIQANANDITNFTCDFSYDCAINIKGSSNTINSVRMRCCAKYPNTTTPITESNYKSNAGIVINGSNNNLHDIPSSRPNIMDESPTLPSMNKIVALVSGSSFNSVDFIAVPRTTTPLIDLIKTVSGNAPATSFKSIWQYYSSSFTQADDVNVLICNNYANTKQDNPPKGTLHYDGQKIWCYNGKAWVALN